MDRDYIDGYQVNGGDQGVIDGPLVDGYQDHGNITMHGGVNDNSDVSSKIKSSDLGSYSSPNYVSSNHTTSIIEAVQSAGMILLYAIQTYTISKVDT